MLVELTDSDLERVAPAALATGRYAGTSPRFTFLSTKTMVDLLHQEGYVVTSAMQGWCKTEGKSGFTKHYLRFCQRDTLRLDEPERVELALRNSHAGNAAWELLLGVWRKVCENGLMRMSDTRVLRVFHRGDVADAVLATTHLLVSQAPQMIEEIQRMQNTPLSESEQLRLAAFGVRSRFDVALDAYDPDSAGFWGRLHKQERLYRPQDFLTVRRPEDAGEDLWKILNRVQEPLLKGGVQVIDRAGVIHTTRRLGDVNKIFTVNTLLWQEAMTMLAQHEEGRTHV